MNFIKCVCILFLFVCQAIYAANESPNNVTEEIEIKFLSPSFNGIKKVDPRIVGGTKAIKGQFRGIVSIQLKDVGHFCGGTLYGNSEESSYILTAAHCLTDVEPKSLRIIGDDLNNSARSIDKNRQIRRVKSIIIHPHYISTKRTIINDLAIIKVTRPFEVTKTFGPVPLPENDVFDDQPCSVAGWGTLQYGSKVSPSDLYAVDINIIPRNVCIPPHKNKYDIGPDVVCAGSMSGGRDSCQGDSGGGLMCANHLAGIVSWGNGCAQKDFPGIYTNVYRYKEWIETNNSNCFNPMISLLISSIGILILNFIF